MTIIKPIILSVVILMLQSCQPKANSEPTVHQILHSDNKDSFSNSNEIVMSEPVTIDTSISVAFLMGQFDPDQHSAFVSIEKQFASRKGMWLHKDTYEAFKKMQKAAKKDGVELVIKSATRNFKAQKAIWEAKWRGERKLSSGENAKRAFPNEEERALKILEYSSMPGTSRHHWGTDVDFNAFNNEYFEKGKGLKEYEWLLANASQYGFCQPYTEKGTARPHGYNEEKWHWSYLPLSLKLTQQYSLQIKNSDISGFEGAAVAEKIDIIEKYVLGIGKRCLEF